MKTIFVCAKYISSNEKQRKLLAKISSIIFVQLYRQDRMAHCSVCTNICTIGWQLLQAIATIPTWMRAAHYNLSRAKLFTIYAKAMEPCNVEKKEWKFGLGKQRERACLAYTNHSFELVYWGDEYEINLTKYQSGNWKFENFVSNL